MFCFKKNSPSVINFYLCHRIAIHSFSPSIMGNRASSAAHDPVAPPLEDYPFLWAIRAPDVLDWKAGIESADEVSAIARQQTMLPARIGTLPKTRLFLGDAKCARNIDRLNELGISAIVNVASPASQNHDLDNDYSENGIRVLRLKAEDEEGFPMLRLHLDTVKKAIKDWRAETPNCNVLIHCTAGINRSGVLVAALLMEFEAMPVLDAVKHIRLRRGNCFLWNTSFQEQLVARARELGLLGPPPQHPANGRSGCSQMLLKGKRLPKRETSSRCFETCVPSALDALIL